MVGMIAIVKWHIAVDKKNVYLCSDNQLLLNLNNGNTALIIGSVFNLLQSPIYYKNISEK